mmetsp:Transcript_30666/g.57381  ORF Transcript_30666/g.57381 Transcript_30666/m.57381 type:complete len:171 (-) Transcript_30666:115-627(-)
MPQRWRHQKKQVCRNSVLRLDKALQGDFFLCSNLFQDKPEEDVYHVVLDLLADSSDDKAVTAQRSYLQLPRAEGGEVHIVKQLVKCGEVIRMLDALYGTLPNPRRPGSMEGGECVICLEKPREVAILHCRHVCLCFACAQITSSTWSFQCPVCRGRVAAMVGIAQLPEAG